MDNNVGLGKLRYLPSYVGAVDLQYPSFVLTTTEERIPKV